jgi:hypothetical protein
MAPQSVHVLITGTCEYVTSQGRRDMTSVIELGLWRWGRCLGYSSGPLVMMKETGRRGGIPEGMFISKLGGRHESRKAGSS